MFSHLPTRRLAQLCLPIFSGLCSIASALVAVRSTSPVATGLSILSGLTSILTTVSALKSHNMWSKFKPRDLEEGSRARDEHSHQDHYNVASSRTSTSPQRSGARLNRRKIFSTRERSHSRESTSITRTYSDEWLPLEETRADNTSSSSSMLQSIAEEDTPVQDLPSQSNHATTSTGANLRRTSSCVPHESYPTLLELMTFARSHYDIRPYECRTCKRRFTKKHVRLGHEKDCKIVPTRF
ncbi:hypothetical protein Moror_5197 [Moniliophthora roreri MCA 2997]|uniref:C2H2-type domain-containing protein n=1 Tax=Moniliophthora roreri (strain MCA 2997) TaxID=1381753 RepID=V2X9R1_MONRO|nr:hypothetical protein Moror_5197 [Moniliophthora roreri MCA 2997]